MGRKKGNSLLTGGEESAFLTKSFIEKSDYGTQDKTVEEGGKGKGHLDSLKKEGKIYMNRRTWEAHELSFSNQPANKGEELSQEIRREGFLHQCPPGAGVSILKKKGKIL